MRTFLTDEYSGKPVLGCHSNTGGFTVQVTEVHEQFDQGLLNNPRAAKMNERFELQRERQAEMIAEYEANREIDPADVDSDFEISMESDLLAVLPSEVWVHVEKAVSEEALLAGLMRLAWEMPE